MLALTTTGIFGAADVANQYVYWKTAFAAGD